MGQLPEDVPAGSDGGPGVESRDGLVDSRLVRLRDGSQRDGSSTGQRDGSGESRLLDRLGHAGDPQDGVDDTGAVDHSTALLNDIVADVVAAVVVLVGTHGCGWVVGW